MLRNIFRAPMSFFDSTPTGRILNRVSVDQSVVDLDIPFRLGGFASTTIQLLGIIGVMSKVTWQVLLLFVPMTMVCLWMQLEIIKLVASQKPIVAAVRVSQKLDIILKNSSQTSVSSACVLKMNCFIIVWKMRQASSVSAEGSTYWALLTTMVLAGRVVLSAEGSSSFCLNTDSEGENYSL